MNLSSQTLGIILNPIDPKRWTLKGHQRKRPTHGPKCHGFSEAWPAVKLQYIYIYRDTSNMDVASHKIVEKRTKLLKAVVGE